MRCQARPLLPLAVLLQLLLHSIDVESTRAVIRVGSDARALLSDEASDDSKLVTDKPTRFDQEAFLSLEDLYIADELEFPVLGEGGLHVVVRRTELLDRSTESCHACWVWVGKSSSDNPEAYRGDMVLTIHQGKLSGAFSCPAGTFQLTHGASGSLRFIAIDDAQLPDESHIELPPELAQKPESSRYLRHGNSAQEVNADAPASPKTLRTPAAPPAQGHQQQQRGLSTTGNAQFRVLVVYSSAAAAAAGGAGMLEADIMSAMDWGNTAYRNSQMQVRGEVAAMLPLESFSSSGRMSTDLYWLQTAVAGTAGTHVDDAARIAYYRERFAADYVAMVLNSGSSCGLSYVYQGGRAWFSAYAVSVSLRSCMPSSFVHEIGHAQGAQHNSQDARSNGAFPWAYGHSACSPTAWRTVMAYQRGCTMPRVAYFSNPLVKFQGQWTGVGTSRTNPGACSFGSAANCRDNALAIETTVQTEGQFWRQELDLCDAADVGTFICVETCGASIRVCEPGRAFDLQLPSNRRCHSRGRVVASGTSGC